MRQNDVTSHRRRPDIISTPCARWIWPVKSQHICKAANLNRSHRRHRKKRTKETRTTKWPNIQLVYEQVPKQAGFENCLLKFWKKKIDSFGNKKYTVEIKNRYTPLVGWPRPDSNSRPSGGILHHNRVALATLSTALVRNTYTWGQLVLLTTILNHKTWINTSSQVLEKTLFAINAIFTEHW